MRTASSFLVAIALVACVTPTARAQPSPGNGGASKVLGLSNPQSPNLSLDAAWRVYLIERDGIQYLQVNDATGTVRAVVGYVSTSHFAVPLGTDEGRVFTQAFTFPQGTSKTTVYRSSEIVLSVHETADGPIWTAEAP